jgi:hypothetical protein
MEMASAKRTSPGCGLVLLVFVAAVVLVFGIAAIFGGSSTSSPIRPPARVAPRFVVTAIRPSADAASVVDVAFAVHGAAGEVGAPDCVVSIEYRNVHGTARKLGPAMQLGGSDQIRRGTDPVRLSAPVAASITAHDISVACVRSTGPTAATLAPSTPGTTTATTSPVPTTSPPVTSATAPSTTAGCSVDAQGNCYQAGSSCPESDHGQTLQGGNGPLTCRDDNGWHWVAR